MNISLADDTLEYIISIENLHKSIELISHFSGLLCMISIVLGNGIIYNICKYIFEAYKLSIFGMRKYNLIQR